MKKLIVTAAALLLSQAASAEIVRELIISKSSVNGSVTGATTAEHKNGLGGGHAVTPMNVTVAEYLSGLAAGEQKTCELFAYQQVLPNGEIQFQVFGFASCETLR
jgi:hypothetical protein